MYLKIFGLTKHTGFFISGINKAIPDETKAIPDLFYPISSIKKWIQWQNKKTKTATLVGVSTTEVKAVGRHD